MIALEILAKGYLPTDDALRHAAKAVAQRDWQDILLLRSGVVDFSPGWHAYLGAVHRIFNANAHTLVLTGVISLFVLFSLGPIVLLRRPEVWPVTLAVVAVMEPQFVMRLMLGRPLVLSMAILVFMCLTWRRLDTDATPRGALVVAALLVAAATWIHGSWYLWGLPIIACFVARQHRVGTRLLAATIVGWIVGALLTGHPLTFLWQNLELGLSIGGGAITAWVYEIQPYPFFPVILLAAALLVVIRRIWLDVPGRTLLRDPVVALAALGYVLGMKSGRFWMDWGTPALVAFFAQEIEALWLAHAGQTRRLLVAGALSSACFLVWTANVNERFNPRLEPTFRTLLRPERSPALPDSGGILYTDDRRIFYEMFYLNPHAPWRYTLGYSPELMPADDYAVYVNRMSSRSIEALEPWARKLRPADRLMIRDPRGIPVWPWLEWQQLDGGFWSARVRVRGAQ